MESKDKKTSFVETHSESKETRKVEAPFVERRKGIFRAVVSRNFVTLVGRRMVFRALFTIVLFSIFFYILWLLFHKTLDDSFRDLLNIIIGSYLVSLSKIVDFWFKKDDEDVKDDEKDPF